MPNEYNGVPTLADLIGQSQHIIDAKNKQKQFESDQQHELLKQVQGAEQQRQLEGYKKQLAQEQQQENMKMAQEYINANSGKNKRASISLSPGGGVNLGGGESSDMSQLMALLGLKATMDDREDRKVERLQDDVTKSGAPQAAESLKRVNQVIPGAFSGQAKFKSVGGIKNLIPNFAVPIAEKLEFLPKGSGDERAALQEAQNAKIYDSSGKQINEAEMKRIQQGMGMGGMFDPTALNSALQQTAQTVVEKNKNITSGYKPQTVNTFKGRGGIAVKSLQELLRGQPSLQPSPAPQSQGGVSTPSGLSPEEAAELDQLRKEMGK
jgi:hypothetical protein